MAQRQGVEHGVERSRVRNSLGPSRFFLKLRLADARVAGSGNRRRIAPSFLYVTVYLHAGRGRRHAEYKIATCSDFSASRLRGSHLVAWQTDWRHEITGSILCSGAKYFPRAGKRNTRVPLAVSLTG